MFQFVAHPSCQQKLVSIWYSDLRTLERANWFLRGIIVLCITVFYPVLAILYWFAPKTRVRMMHINLMHNEYIYFDIVDFWVFKATLSNVPVIRK